MIPDDSLLPRYISEDIDLLDGEIPPPKTNSRTKIFFVEYWHHFFGLSRLLLDRGVNIHGTNYRALSEASANGHLDVVKLLLDYGANVHALDDRALRMASTNGHVKVVKLLLEGGANVHANDDRALRDASLYGYTEIVKLLLEAGANGKVLRDVSWHSEVVKLLKQYKQYS